MIPLFSIITVCYNSAATLPATAASLRVQTNRDYEWIVVDGASSDDTAALARASGIAEQRVLSEPDRGIYDAMNKGIALAQGEYVHFLNSDDRFSDADVLADVARALRESPPVDLLYGDVIYVAANGRTRRRFAHINRYTLLTEDLCHQAVFARRQLFDRIGGFDLAFRWNADYDWLIRAFRAGVRSRCMARAICDFYVGGAHTSDPSAHVAERRRVRERYVPSALLGTLLLTSRAVNALHRRTLGRGIGEERLG